MDIKQKGKFYEEKAKEFLIQKGYSFIDENFSCKYGEIDLIFKDCNTLVIVEVKARKKKIGFEIKKSMDKKKVKRILKSTETYIAKNRIFFDEIRFDAIFFETVGEKYEILHFINWI